MFHQMLIKLRGIKELNIENESREKFMYLSDFRKKKDFLSIKLVEEITEEISDMIILKTLKFYTLKN